MQAIKVGYTTIMHEPRLNFGLSLNEYAVASLIFHLSTSPKAPVPGWCSAGREKLGSFLGLSRQAIINIIDRLANIQLVEVNPETRYVKTTLDWYENFECFSYEPESALQGVKKVDRVPNLFTADCKECLQGRCKDSLHNNNTLIINTDNSKYTIKDFIQTVAEITGKGYKTISERGQRNFESLIKKGYSKESFEIAIKEATKVKSHIDNKFLYLTPEFFTRQDKVELYLHSNGGAEKSNTEPNKPTPRNSDSGGKKEYD